MSVPRGPLRVLLTVGVLLTVALPVSGQGDGERALSGEIEISTDFVVSPGDTLRIQPGARLTGTGRVLVLGALQAVGVPDAPVRLEVPVVVNATAGISTFRHVLFQAPPDGDGPRLTLEAGDVRVEEATFAGGGVLVNGSRAARLVVDRTSFRDSTGPAIQLRGAYDARLDACRFTLTGLAMEAAFTGNASRLIVGGSTFARNGGHVRLNFQGDGNPERPVRFVENDFGPTAGGPAVHVLAEAAPGDAHRLFLAANRFRGAPEGLNVTGPGVRVESYGDAFTNLTTAVAGHDAQIAFTGAAFDGNVRDLHVTGERASVQGLLPAPAVAPTPPGWGALVGAVALVLLLAGGGLLVASRSHSAPPAASAPEPVSASPVTPPVDPDSLEARILADVAVHPGSPQSAIARRLGLSRQALHYHVKKLEGAGVIVKVNRGRKTLCYPAGDVPSRES